MKPGQNYQGFIGYRIHLGWGDRLRVLFGLPLLLGVRLLTPHRIPTIRTTATLLVGGHPAQVRSRLEVVDTPPGDAYAPPTG